MIPTVSILFPVFNEDKQILILAIKSILKQDFSDFELIIIDDSTDPEIMDYLDRLCLDDSRVFLHRPSFRLGLVKALNFGLTKCRANLIARMDSDDIQVSNRLSFQVAYMFEHTDVDVLGSFIFKIDYQGMDIGIRKYPIYHNDIYFWSTLINPICHASVMFRRCALNIAGMYDERYTAAEDYELWLRLISKKFRFHNLPLPLVRYRVANIIRRNSSNWKFNLRAKIVYFKMNNFVFRFIGILLVFFMWLLPTKIKGFFYSLYSRLQ